MIDRWRLEFGGCSCEGPKGETEEVPCISDTNMVDTYILEGVLPFQGMEMAFWCWRRRRKHSKQVVGLAIR